MNKYLLILFLLGIGVHFIFLAIPTRPFLTKSTSVSLYRAIIPMNTILIFIPL